MSEKENEKTLGYVIAAIALGAAVGNMFVARRLRSFSKIKSPYKETNNHTNSGTATAAEHTMNGGSQQQHHHQWKDMSEEEKRQEQRYKNHNYQQEQQEKVRQQYEAYATKKKIPNTGDNGVDGYMRSHLVILHMDQSKKPTITEVKEHYRKYALMYHPDRLPVGDSKRKQYEQKFSEATSSYKTLKELIGKE